IKDLIARGGKGLLKTRVTLPLGEPAAWLGREARAAGARHARWKIFGENDAKIYFCAHRNARGSRKSSRQQSKTPRSPKIPPLNRLLVTHLMQFLMQVGH